MASEVLVNTGSCNGFVPDGTKPMLSHIHDAIYISSLGHNEYHQVSNISHTKSQNLNDSHLVLKLSLPNPLKPGVENDDVVGATPPGDAPTTSEWSTV